MPPLARPQRGARTASPKPTTATVTGVHEQFGLEVPKHLRWHKWHAEGELIKTLSVKNVSPNVLRVTYKLLPSSSAFSVDFPQTYKLSPGMVANIQVAFRPAARQTYADCLELQCGTATIAVPLEALLPASKLQLPPALDFGCVPAKEQVQQQLPIKNVGDAQLRFAWKIEAPFAILPAAGQLAPGQTLTCQVLFDPQEAAAYRVAAACSLDNGELLTVQINGMAKFPFLTLESSCVDFGSVVVGQTAEGSARFGNYSAVPAHFALAATGGSGDGALSIQPTQGTLQPNSYSVLRIVYTPKATDTFSCQSFSLSTAGGNKLSLTCQGTAAGPRLQLSSRVFAFGNVRSGQAPSKVLYLENCSDVPLSFEFLAEEGGVFWLTKPKGVLAPRCMTHTAVCFKGTAPANYWQRIVCLVKDAEPVAIDALATCFDSNCRPPPLNYSHIAAYLDGARAAAAAAGGQPGFPGACSTAGSAPALGAVSADALQQPRALAYSSTGTPLQQTALQAQLPACMQQQPQQQLVGPDSWQLLFEGLHTSPGITVTDSQVDFGSCSRLSPCEARSFTVNNTTNFKLLVSLLAPPWQDPSGPAGKAVQVFQAFPETLELRPNSSATIRLAFRPPRDGQYYVQGLLLMAGLKSRRSFRLVGEGQTVVPPWCIGLLASGNTFANCNPEFSPKASLSSSSVNFPPCRLGYAVHQTLALRNSGDTPVHFRFTSPSSGGSGTEEVACVVGGCSWFGAFGVLPSQGVLEPKSQHLVAVRFKPNDLHPAQLKLTCVFNNMAVNSSTVLMTGCASEPQLSWDVQDSQLFFRPTCVGASSQRNITVTNVSRVTVGWQWLLSKKLQEAVTVQPMSGVLRGFESTQVTLRFAPARQQVYNARAALLLLPPGAVEAAVTVADSSSGGHGPSVLSITAAGLDPAGQADLEAEKQADDDSAAAAAAHSVADSESAEKLILTIVGEATEGALRVEPSSVSFGAVHVGHPQSRTLSLINQSNGVLRYSIQLVDEAREGVDRSAAACEFGAATAALLADSGGAGGGVSSGAGRLEDCWLDEAEGIVNARAAKTITLTLLPRRRGQYTLSLHLRGSSMPPLPRLTGMRSASAGGCSSIAGRTAVAAATAAAAPGLIAVSASSPGSACAVLGSEAAAVNSTGHSTSHSAVVSVAGSSADAAAAWSAAGSGSRPISGCKVGDEALSNAVAAGFDGKPPLATVSVTATASFPSLLVTDVFCQGIPKQVAWQMLSVPQLNAELRAPVTEAELQAQVLSDKGRLTNDNAAALLPPFEVDLGIAAAGRGPRVFWIGLSNEGQLPLKWELHSYDTPEVELENWVEPARPLTQAEKERAFIIDNAVFELHPRSGRLQPGATEKVCFTFNPVQEGFYQLPLFLRVKDGKQLQLQLSGRAVSPCAQLPLLLRGGQSCVLAAAPLGELEPPLQCYTLRNGGPAPLHYSLDITPLQQLTHQNYGAEVIKYAGGSPLTGEVPPGDVAVFNWLFQPLEAKQYSVALPLGLGPAAPVPLLLRGSGYHPRQAAEQAAPTQEEVAQRWQDWVGFSAVPQVAPISRALQCSQELLDLGTCLPAALARRLLVLHNAAAAPLQFVWDLGVFEAERGAISGRLAIVPATGVLKPGESRVCQVSFQSGLAPQVFCGEVFCYARCEDTAAEQLHAGLPPPAWGGSAAESQLQMQQEGGDERQAAWQRAVQAGEAVDGEEVEEVIAQHPERPLAPYGLGKKAQDRLPLHLSMTEAVRRKFDLLDQQYTRTLQQRQQQTLPYAAAGSSSAAGSNAASLSAHSAGTWGANAPADPGPDVEPQLLTVTVQGRVLSKAHIQAGNYIPAAEQADALKFLAVSHLLPAVEQPVSLLLPPGSMGTSAAAAAAAASAAAAAEDENSAAAEASSSGSVKPEVSQQQAGLSAAAAVLEGLLADAWADGEVAAAFDHLEPAPVPLFAQLRQQPVESTSLQQPMPVLTNVGQLAGEDAGGQAEDANTVAAEQAEGAAAAKVLKQPEFQAFADFVLESAVVGILQEGVLQQELHAA